MLPSSSQAQEEEEAELESYLALFSFVPAWAYWLKVA
jgi:hypothetical protein